MNNSITIGNTKYNLLQGMNTFTNDDEFQIRPLIEKINSLFQPYECQRLNPAEDNNPIVFNNYLQIAALNTLLQSNPEQYQGLRLANPREAWQYIQAINGEIPLNQKEPYLQRHIPLGLIITANHTESYLGSKLDNDIIAWDITINPPDQNNPPKTTVNTKNARYREIPQYIEQKVSPFQPLEDILSPNPRAGPIIRAPNYTMKKELHIMRHPTYIHVPIGLGVLTYSLSEKSITVGKGRYAKQVPHQEMKIGPHIGLSMNGYVVIAKDL